jgi:hypothetical protein
MPDRAAHVFHLLKFPANAPAAPHDAATEVIDCLRALPIAERTFMEASS